MEVRIDAIRLSMSYIILGLGNPGEEYQSTRHNSGALIIDECAKKISAGEWKKDNNRQSLVAKGELKNEKILLVKPQAFMNKSGVAVKDMAGEKKKLGDLVVVFDDFDFAVGGMK